VFGPINGTNKFGKNGWLTAVGKRLAMRVVEADQRVSSAERTLRYYLAALSAAPTGEGRKDIANNIDALLENITDLHDRVLPDYCSEETLDLIKAYRMLNDNPELFTGVFGDKEEE
jgi:hypothetical protein